MVGCSNLRRAELRMQQEDGGIEALLGCAVLCDALEGGSQDPQCESCALPLNPGDGTEAVMRYYDGSFPCLDTEWLLDRTLHKSLDRQTMWEQVSASRARKPRASPPRARRLQQSLTLLRFYY